MPTSLPPLPGDTLDFWAFDGTNWQSALGAILGVNPIAVSNVTCVASWSSNALEMDSTNAAILQYPTSYTIDDLTWSTLTCDIGSIEFWFKPNWSGTNMGGTGPGTAGRLIEVGTWTTNASNGFWGLYLNPEGTRLTFSAQAGGVDTNYLTTDISWTSNEWYFVVLTYTSNSSKLYLDGNLVTNGLGVTVIPSSTVRAAGFRIGSDGGMTQARGQFENLVTCDYVLTDWEVASDFDADWPLAAAWTPGGGGGGGGGDLPSGGGGGGGGPMGPYAGPPVYITNVVCTPVTNQGWTVSLTIAGGTSGVLYDLFTTTNVTGNSITNSQWVWLGPVWTDATFQLTNQQGPLVFYVLGTPQDTDDDGVTDAYETLVSKTRADNPDSNGDGLSDGWVVWLGLNPVSQPWTRSTYTYDALDWLRQVSGTRTGTVSLDAEGNVLSVSQ